MDFADSIERTDELEVWKYETLTYSFKEIPDSILEGLKRCAEKRKYTFIGGISIKAKFYAAGIYK